VENRPVPLLVGALALMIVLQQQAGAQGGRAAQPIGPGLQTILGGKAGPRQPAPDIDADKDKEEKEEADRKFSPIGFYDLLAYQQAFPGVVGSPEVAQASARRYEAFAGIERGGGEDGSTWRNLGPSTVGDSGNASGNISGRVSTLAISPRCSLGGSCRMWVGTAGGGVWRTDDAMNTSDPKWRWVGTGLGTNSIGALDGRSERSVRQHDLRRHRRDEHARQFGAGTGLYRSTDGGDSWSRIPTMIVDTAVSPSAIDFTATRGISTVVIEPGNSQTLYVATTTAMLGMTAVRGGQTQTTGYPQPRVGLYKTTNRGESWTLIWVPPLDAVMPPNPNLGVGVGDTMFGRAPRQARSEESADRLRDGLEQRDSSIGAIPREWRRVVQARLRHRRPRAVPRSGDVRSDRQNGKTRMYVYNGTEAVATQAFYRLDNADVPAAALVTGAGAAVANTSAWIALSSDSSAQTGFTSRRMCSSQCSTIWLWPRRQASRTRSLSAASSRRTFGAPTIRSTDAGVGFSISAMTDRRRATRATWMCGLWCFIPAIPTLRSRF
jgi:hypothetical protein